MDWIKTDLSLYLSSIFALVDILAKHKRGHRAHISFSSETFSADVI